MNRNRNREVSANRNRNRNRGFDTLKTETVIYKFLKTETDRNRQCVDETEIHKILQPVVSYTENM